MKIWFIAALALLGSGLAHATYIPPTAATPSAANTLLGNNTTGSAAPGGLTPAQVANMLGTYAPGGFSYLSPVTLNAGAKGDAKTGLDGAITAATNVFNSQNQTFFSTDCAPPGSGCTGTANKTIWIDKTGTSYAPFKSTITGYVDAHDVTLNDNAIVTPLPGANQATIVAATDNGSYGSGYVPGDCGTVSGGTFVTATKICWPTTQVGTVAINAVGSGGTANAANCIVQGTTGVGEQLFRAKLTLNSSGQFSTIVKIVFQGSYTTNPTLTGEAVTTVSGCGNFTGGTLNLSMIPNDVLVNVAGLYSVKPNPSTNLATTGQSNGSGAAFNVSFDNGVKFTWGTDDTAAVNATISLYNTLLNTGAAPCILFPAGKFMVQTPLTAFARFKPPCAKGDSPEHTFILVDPTAPSGDVFATSDTAFLLSDYPPNGSTIPVSSNKAGPYFGLFTLVGWADAINQQNALMFYDQVDFVRVDHVSLEYMNGYCLGSGFTKNNTNAFLRESIFVGLRLRVCGSTALQIPAAEFTSVGSSDASNNLWLFDFMDVFPKWTGLLIHSSNTNGRAPHGIYFMGGMCHEIQNPASPIAAPCTQIGDTTNQNAAAGIYFEDFRWNAAQPGQASILLTAPDRMDEPYDLHFCCQISSGANGVDVEYGKLLEFRFNTVISDGYALKVAASTQTVSTLSQGITWNMMGNETKYLVGTGYQIDSTACPYVTSPTYGRLCALGQLPTWSDTGGVVSQSGNADAGSTEYSGSITIPSSSQGNFTMTTTKWPSPPHCACWFKSTGATRAQCTNTTATTLVFAASAALTGTLGYQCAREGF